MSNIVLLGQVGCGKDYVLSRLVKKYKLRKTVTDTTRPIREGEINGIHYNFMSEGEFKENLDKGKYIEHQEYFTVEGVWCYGTSKESIKPSSIIILDKDGFLEYKKYVPNCVSVYLSCIDETERFYRSIKRLNECNIKDVDEVYRRIKKDESKFKDIHDLVDFVVPQIYNETTLDLVFGIVDRLGVEKI